MLGGVLGTRLSSKQFSNIIHLIFKTTLLGEYYPHFPEEEAKVEEGLSNLAKVT